MQVKLIYKYHKKLMQIVSIFSIYIIVVSLSYLRCSYIVYSYSLILHKKYIKNVAKYGSYAYAWDDQ